MDSRLKIAGMTHSLAIEALPATLPWPWHATLDHLTRILVRNTNTDCGLDGRLKGIYRRSLSSWWVRSEAMR